MRTPLAKILAAAACLTLLATAQEPQEEPDFAKVEAPPSPEAIAARQAGIELAWGRALATAQQIAASQGFRQRDTCWAAPLPPDRFTILPLQLFAGNDYYIVVGTDATVDRIAAATFDPDRMVIESLPDQGDHELVLHLKPKVSGHHLLRLYQKQPSPTPIHCAVTYVYR